MPTMTVVALLLATAVLEAGGDALVRRGLHDQTGWRWALIALGGVLLLGYGIVVNLPAWEFGRLLGVYVVAFFLVAQAVAWFAFSSAPTAPIVVGGALIVAGGLVMTFWSA